MQTQSKRKDLEAALELGNLLARHIVFDATAVFLSFLLGTTPYTEDSTSNDPFFLSDEDVLMQSLSALYLMQPHNNLGFELAGNVEAQSKDRDEAYRRLHQLSTNTESGLQHRG